MKNIGILTVFGLLLLATGGLYALPAAARPSALEQHCASLVSPQDPVQTDYLFCQCSKPENAADKPQAEAWCDGYFQAILNLIHSNQIAAHMFEDQCFDLNGYIPDWYGPTREAFMAKAQACPDAKCLQSMPLPFIIESVVTAYPCDAITSESPIRGTQKRYD